MTESGGTNGWSEYKREVLVRIQSLEAQCRDISSMVDRRAAQLMAKIESSRDQSKEEHFRLQREISESISEFRDRLDKVKEESASKIARIEKEAEGFKARVLTWASAIAFGIAVIVPVLMRLIFG